MINRPQYLDKLHQLRDTDLIKVVSGVRRCGKSTLLAMFQQELLDSGVSKKQIQSFNFEKPENLDWKQNWRGLYDHIVANLDSSAANNYIFLDEIQNIDEFERLADGLFVTDKVDLYITGSNAYFLSSDLATLLAGRYLEIKILPLSFAEYVSAFGDKTQLDSLFHQYLVYGGFPRVVDFHGDSELIREYLQGIYNTVLLKDVMTRTGVNDKTVMEDVAKFMLGNVGNITAAKRIADTMTSRGRAISHTTIDKYIAAYVDSLLFYPVEKVGLKGKKTLYAQKKYYAVDTGLRQITLGINQAEQDRGHLLENVVYLELLRRNQTVEFGKVDELEVDFVVRTKDGRTKYYQVAETMLGEETRTRELRPLDKISDHNAKYVLTGDFGNYSYNGIEQINVRDWLLEKV